MVNLAGSNELFSELTKEGAAGILDTISLRPVPYYAGASVPLDASSFASASKLRFDAIEKEANRTTMAGGFMKADDESVTTDDVTPLTSASSSPASFSTPPTLEDSLVRLELGHRLDDEATTTTAMNMVSNAGNGAVIISSNDDGGWRTMPASKKAQRTLNPIRAIMDPIMATAQKSRDDGKSQISLAVSALYNIHV